jgi:anti-sigma regulatory factor (Ser/Thr protein kinase)
MPASTTVRRPAVQHRPRPPQPPPVRPLRAVLDLGAVPTAPGCARAWTRVILREWQLAALSDAGELIVSELATNALLASRREGAASFRLILTRDRDELAILVRDFCQSVPRPQSAGEEDENGRGLLLVEAMCGRSGWHPLDDGTLGKVVWAVLEAEPVASSDLAAASCP